MSGLKLGFRAYHLFVILMLFSQMVKAINVRATVDRNRLGVGDTLTLSVAISSDKPVAVEAPKNIKFNNFQVIRTWTETESKSVFRGGQFQVLRVPKYNFLLRALKPGRLKLGPVSFVVAGKKVISSAISVVVIKSSSNPLFSDRSDPLANPSEDLFASLLKRKSTFSGFRSQPKNYNGVFFIQVELNKKKLFLGEELLATWYIYSKGLVRDIDTLKFPSLGGLWKEDIEVATRLIFRNEMINGIIYRKALLASYALFPMRVGELEIDPYVAKCTVTLLTQGFRMQVPKQETHSSATINIDILALPSDGRPDFFTGGVGKFKLKLVGEMNPQFEVGRPFVLNVKVFGEGNAKLVDFPQVEWPSGLELFESSNKAKFFKTRRSEKIFSLVLIARKPGKMLIPKLEFAFFNPIEKKYYTEELPEVNIEIIPGSGPMAVASNKFVAENNQNEIVEMKQGKVEIPLWEGRVGGPFISPLFKVVGWVLWGIVLFAGLIYKTGKSLGWLAEKESILSEVKGRFKSIEKELANENWRKVGIGVTNVIYYLVGEVSGEGGAARPMDQLLLKVSPSFRREMSQPLNRLMSAFEVISFAPDDVVKSVDKREFKTQVKEIKRLLIGVLEKQHDQEEQISKSV